MLAFAPSFGKTTNDISQESYYFTEADQEFSVWSLEKKEIPAQDRNFDQDAFFEGWVKYYNEQEPAHQRVIYLKDRMMCEFSEVTIFPQA